MADTPNDIYKHYTDGIVYQYNGESTTAFNEFRAAAEAGFPPAQYEVAQALAKGEGTVADLDKARDWLKRAADQKYAPAEFSYGSYLMAVGTNDPKRDATKGLTLVTDAANQGYVEAQVTLFSFYSKDGSAKDLEKAQEFAEKSLNGKEKSVFVDEARAKLFDTAAKDPSEAAAPISEDTNPEPQITSAATETRQLSSQSSSLPVTSPQTVAPAVVEQAAPLKPEADAVVKPPAPHPKSGSGATASKRPHHGHHRHELNMDHLLATEPEGDLALQAAAAGSEQKMRGFRRAAGMPQETKDDWAKKEHDVEAKLSPRGRAILHKLKSLADRQSDAARTVKSPIDPRV